MSDEDNKKVGTYCDLVPISIGNDSYQFTQEKAQLLKNFVEFLNAQKEINHDNKNVIEILPKLLSLQNSKEHQYGRSWCKHNDISAFFNVERKWDRIFNIMSRVLEKGVDTLETSQDNSTPTETFMDTIVDLGLYSLMWVGLIKELRPEQYEKFLINNELN